MTAPRQNLINAPKQTLSVVSGQLIFESRRGITLPASPEPAGHTGLLYFDQASTELRYYAESSWIGISLADEIDLLADKRKSSHIAVASPRPLAAEHKYVGYNNSTPEWQIWSTDAFVDFDQDATTGTNITFSNDCVVVNSFNLNNHILANISNAAAPDDALNKQTNDSIISNFRELVDAKTADMRSQIDANHTQLQQLWTSRQITVGTTHPDYATQKAMYDQMVSVTKQLLASGRI